METLLVSSVNTAIAQAQGNGRILLVILADGSEGSQVFDTALDTLLRDPQVAEIVSSRFVATRLVQGSVEAGHFQQIRPNVHFPSLYALHPSMQPRELLVAPSSPAHMIDYLNELLSASQQGQQQRQQQQAPVNVINTNTAPEPTNTTTTTSSTQAAEFQEQYRRVRERLAENAKQQQEQQTQEAEKEKAQREQGNQPREANLSKEESERVKAIAKRNKEKAEQEKYRNEVKEKIRADRAERQTQKVSTTSPATIDFDASSLPSSNDYITSSTSDSVRLAIRLLDGSVVRESFQPSDTLASVHHFVAQHMDGVRDFVLARSVPLRVFEHEQDDCSSLQNLGLAPSTSLIVKMRVRKGEGAVMRQIRATPGSMWNPKTWLAWLWILLGQIWSIVYDFFRTVYDPQVPSAVTPIDERSNSEVNSGVKTATAEPTTPKKNDSGSNIQTLHSLGSPSSADKDGKNPMFYNGNSTQYGGDD